jgi:hypothetical protein
MAAQAEDEDNIAEQKRQHGKRVRYGEVVQVVILLFYLLLKITNCIKTAFFV